MKVFYIDSIDVNHLYGSGGVPLYRSAILNKGEFFYFVGTSDTLLKNEWNCVKIFGATIKYFALRSPKRSKFSRNFLFALSTLTNWRKIQIIDKECRIILTRSYTILWLFSFFKKNYKVVYYAPGLGNPLEMGRFSFMSKFKNIYLFIHLRALKKAEGLMAAVSGREVIAYNELLRKAKSTIYFEQVTEAVDTEFFKPIDKSEALAQLNLPFISPKTTYVFSYIGRIAQVKGIPLIIDAFTLFCEKHSSSKLVIAGDGELYNEINEYIDNSSCWKNIHMLGSIDPFKVRNVINISNACLFGSYVEGFSLSMLEVLSCGKPIVSTTVSGTDELIFPGVSGFTISERNPYLYCAAMEKVININNSSANCRSLVLNSYTIDKQWQKIMKYFTLYD